MIENTIWPEKSWSHEELIIQFPLCKNLGELIEAAEILAKRENLVVCEVRTNGMRLSEKQEVQYKETPVTDINVFEVRVQKVSALLDESLAGCYQYLEKLSESLDVAAQLFRAEDIVAAHKYYKTCVEGTELFIEMITHYKIVSQASRPAANPEEETHPNFDWKLHEGQLLHTLGQILDAYRQKNYILVADLLEYDLINVITVWREELIKLEKNNQRDGHIDIGTGNEPGSEIQT